MRREIIRIDQKKCDGCGRCVTTCAEGAIQIVDGKARLVSDVYCDGLGACIGECPRGALTIEKREADAFDEKAVGEHLKTNHHRTTAAVSQKKNRGPVVGFSCPGSRSQLLHERQPMLTKKESGQIGTLLSELSQWPVQLHLVPAQAPYFQGTDLLIAADCVPFAYADFHRRFLRARTLLVGCPKLDDVEIYHQKLTEIFRKNDIRLLEVVYMEVPCCFGLVQLVRTALQGCGKTIPLVLTKVSIRGEIFERAQPVLVDQSETD